MNGVCNGTFFWPRPLGPWGGAKRSKIIKFQLQSQFQRFFNQTLCVFSHMKDIKHIWSPGSCPRGVGLRGTVGGLGGQFFSKFNQIWCVSYLHEWHLHRHLFWSPCPLGPWGGTKRSNIIKSELQSQFQRFLNQTLCIFSDMKDI